MQGGLTQGSLVSVFRVYYFKHYINQVLKAISLDGVAVRGYFAWALVDVWEWTAGFTENFGLHRVNLSTEVTSSRTPKLSADFYTRIVRENGSMENQNMC